MGWRLLTFAALISETPRGTGCILGNILFLLSPFKALTDCLLPAKMGSGRGNRSVVVGFAQPCTAAVGARLGGSSVGAGAEGCPAKKQKPNRAWFPHDCVLQTIKRTLSCSCSPISPADPSM